MATEVSSLMRLLARHDKEGGGVESPRSGGGGGDLVTRDLLGGRWAAPPTGAWKGQDLGVKDLDLPLSCSRPPPRLAAPNLHALLQDQAAAASLDLGLRSPPPPPPPAEYQSVCTLEKVRSALERAQRGSPPRKPPAAPSVPASPSSSSTTMSTAKRPHAAGPDEGGESVTKPPPSSSPSSSSPSSSSSAVVQGGGAATMEAAGCPSCLLYVLVSRSDPRCPRCSSAVPLRPLPGKRPRIDLNAAAAAAAAEPAAAVDPKATLRFL